MIERGRTAVTVQLPFIMELPTTIQATVSFIDWAKDVAVLQLKLGDNLQFQHVPFIPLNGRQLPEIWGHTFRALGVSPW